ncbi:MAG: hypothetical protein LH615_01625, partial [Ferruginibacter sp.]|nr:hypothetical protein [Ferruginibacter sp.]
EVSSDLYIAVSEDGEAPEHHLYKIKDLNSPELIKWFNSPKDKEFLLSFLDKSGKKNTIKIEVYLSKIDIKIL